MKETKAVRIRKLLLIGAITDAAIAKVVKCHVSYVYMIKKAMDKVAPVKFKDQVVEKKKFSEFDASPKAIVWKGRNPWFGVDKDKTNYAIGLCMEAHTQGINPKSSKYYTFIDKGMWNYIPPRREKDALDHLVIAGSPSILNDANDIIWGDREKTYGTPDVNLKRIATLWNAYMSAKAQSNSTIIEPEDVCWMMVLLKASRQMNTPKRDNLIDAAGYIGLIERIQK